MLSPPFTITFGKVGCGLCYFNSKGNDSIYIKESKENLALQNLHGNEDTKIFETCIIRIKTLKRLDVSQT